MLAHTVSRIVQLSATITLIVGVSACGGTRDDGFDGMTGASAEGGVDDAGEGTGAGPGDSGSSGDGGSGDGGSDDGGSGGTDSDDGGSDDGGSDDGGSDDGDSGGSSQCDQWTDPFPATPAQNDPAFAPGSSWHVGPGGVEYQLRIPEGLADTADLPLVLTADVYNGGLRFEEVIALHFPVEAGGRNAWIDDEFWNCWPGCSVFTFLGVDGTRELLEDLGGRLRFAHDRVFMDGVGEGREEITIGLHPTLQPYFSGVVHYYSEWQMAVCPQVQSVTPSACAPKVFFGMSGCDHSYCPSQSCHDTVEAAGFEVERAVGGDVSGCTCPLQDLNARPHLIPMPDWIREAHVDFIKTTVK